MTEDAQQVKEFIRNNKDFLNSNPSREEVGRLLRHNYAMSNEAMLIFWALWCSKVGLPMYWRIVSTQITSTPFARLLSHPEGYYLGSWREVDIVNAIRYLIVKTMSNAGIRPESFTVPPIEIEK